MVAVRSAQQLCLATLTASDSPCWQAMIDVVDPPWTVANDLVGDEVMQVQIQPIAKAELLIRRPVAQVFDAFVDPDVITKFWFDKSTGPLECGEPVEWHWDLCDAPVEVRVKAVEENRRILIEWGTENPTTVEWIFTPRSEDTTYVSVINAGFAGSGDEIVSQALDSTGGFALVLAAAKAYLEHGIGLNIVADRF